MVPKSTFCCCIAGAIRFSTQDGILRFEDGERLRSLGIAFKGRSSGIRISLGKLCVSLKMERRGEERRRDEIERRFDRPPRNRVDLEVQILIPASVMPAIWPWQGSHLPI
jgi:hypothetical protein